MRSTADIDSYRRHGAPLFRSKLASSGLSKFVPPTRHPATHAECVTFQNIPILPGPRGIIEHLRPQECDEVHDPLESSEPGTFFYFFCFFAVARVWIGSACIGHQRGICLARASSRSDAAPECLFPLVDPGFALGGRTAHRRCQSAQEMPGPLWAFSRFDRRQPALGRRIRRLPAGSSPSPSYAFARQSYRRPGRHGNE